jgi:hypothetical protein
MTFGKALIGFLAAIVSVAPGAPARADSARITGLQDVNFGTVLSSTDQSNSQSLVICSYKNNPHRTPYSVTALGSGSGGAFALASGAATLAYDVQWVSSPAQTGGTMLQSGVPSSGYGNGATGFDCPLQPTTASLTVTIRSGDLSAAPAGNYSGSLQITIVPE